MTLKGMSIEEAKAIIVAYARENIIANTRIGIAFQTVLRELDKIESRPKGKWIEYPDCLKYEGALLSEDFVCSNCEAVWNAIDNEGERFKFCPECGAVVFQQGELDLGRITK